MTKYTIIYIEQGSGLLPGALKIDSVEAVDIKSYIQSKAPKYNGYKFIFEGHPKFVHAG